MAQLAAYSYLDDVKLTGARFYRYERGFLHHKVMLVDGGLFAGGLGIEDIDAPS